MVRMFTTLLLISALAALLAVAAFPVAADEDLVPAEIGGSPASVSTSSGLEMVAALDPAYEPDREFLDELETLLAVTRRPIDAVSVASAYPTDGVSTGWVTALRVEGADGSVLEALAVAGVRDALLDPRQERVDVGDKIVTRFGASDAELDVVLTLYALHDTVWLVGGTPDEAAALLEQLP